MHSQISTLHLIKRFVPYFKKYKGVLFLDLFCAALTTVCELVFPLIVRYITDMGMNHLESLTVQIILTLGGFYLVLRLIDTAANYYMADVGHIMGAKIETDMRKDLFAHLQKLSYSYYDETKIGQLMARITSDLFDVTEFAHHCPEEFFIAFLKILVSFLILCNSSVLLTVIIFAILPLMLLAAMYFFLSGARLSVADVFVNSARKQIDLLLYGADLVPQGLQSDLFNILSIDENPAGGDLVESGN